MYKNILMKSLFLCIILSGICSNLTFGERISTYRTQLLFQSLKPKISTDPTSWDRTRMRQEWLKSPRTSIPEKKHLIEKVESVKLAEIGAGRKTISGQRLADYWSKEQLNIIFTKSGTTWESQPNVGGINFEPRYVGPMIEGLRDIEFVNSDSQEGDYLLQLTTSEGTFISEPFDKIAIKAAYELAQRDKRATITLDPIPTLNKQNNTFIVEEQEFFTEGIEWDSTAAFVLAEADLLLKSIDLGYDLINQKDAYEFYRGLLSTQYYDNVYEKSQQENQVWVRKMITVKECSFTLSDERIVFLPPTINIDLGAKMIIKGVFQEVNKSFLSSKDSTNQQILEQTFHSLLSKKEFYPWKRLIQTANLTILFDLIRNSNRELFDRLYSSVSSINKPSYTKRINIKKSFNLLRLSADKTKYIPYSNEQSGKISVQGQYGGVDFDPFISKIEYNKNAFLSLIYDYLEIMTKERFYTKTIQKIFYDPFTDLPVFFIDDANNQVFLDYDEYGLKFIGLSNSEFDSYYYLEFLEQENRNSEFYEIHYNSTL